MMFVSNYIQLIFNFRFVGVRAHEHACTEAVGHHLWVWSTHVLGTFCLLLIGWFSRQRANCSVDVEKLGKLGRYAAPFPKNGGFFVVWMVQLAANWVWSIYHIRRTCMQRQQYFFHIRVWSKVLWLTEETHQNWSRGKMGNKLPYGCLKKKLHMVAMLKNLSLIKEDVLSQ